MTPRAETTDLPFLKRLLTPGVRAAASCEFCASERRADHRHVVDLSKRCVLCVCDACYLLFTDHGAARGRYRAVPERWIALGEDSVSEVLQLPVGLAFILNDSTAGRTTVFYPSPAGATESPLAQELWADLAAAQPLVSTLVPDVEALLVRRTREHSAMFIVPVTDCYSLVGVLRTCWRGFDGGPDARSRIDAFFDDLARRSRPAASGGACA